MADVIGMSDVSSPDTGKGSVLKTGGGRRKYNVKKRKNKMPNKAKCKMMVGPGKKYKTMSECMSYGGKKMGKTQKAGTSAKAEQDMVGTAMAKSKNVRMKNRIKKNLSKSGYGG